MVLKILIINDYGTPHGGAEIATIRLRDGLNARGHQTLFFSTSARETDIASAADIECVGTTSRYRTLLQTMNWSARRVLDDALATFCPDVVHVGMFLTQLSPYILPALRAFPTVYYAHWLRAICPTGNKLLPDGTLCMLPTGWTCHQAGCLPLKDWIPLMLQLRLMNRWRGYFDHVATNSEASRSALCAGGFGDVSVIPCGVPKSPTAGRDFLSASPTVVYCGRLSRQKGLHVLFSAWRAVRLNIPNAQLWIIGDGPERLLLEHSTPAGVTFFGHLPPDEVIRVARPAWIHVVPSLGLESFGLTAVEAMMRGTAVVASRTGGLSEVVLDGITGQLVNPNDSEALAVSLAMLLNDRDRCVSLGERGRKRAQALFSEESYVQRFETLYESMRTTRSLSA